MPVTCGIHEPAVAGTFYPGEKAALSRLIDECFADSVNTTDRKACGQAEPPVLSVRLKALISPHAGYVYSGPVAASGFNLLPGKKFDRVVVLGPSHHVSFKGVAAPDAAVFRTPLGDLSIDVNEVAALVASGFVVLNDAPHRHEHSVEVQLPFLQKILKPGFKIIPLAAGNTSPETVAHIFERYWNDVGTLIIVSSDLSHFQDYKSAKTHDLQTAKRITAMDHESLDLQDACGLTGICGLLKLAKKKKALVELLDLRTSGDITGDKSRGVVGYGSFGVFEC